MKFGVFDQNDRSGHPLQEQYSNRLRLAEHYDRLGFHCFHMSEHHGTTLSMTPSPSVWMAALSQRTRRIRLCPLVYLLPTYNPARLYEEICMLDHLSGGRFEFGVGRGASPHELDALGLESAAAARMYAEAFETLQRCFTEEAMTTASVGVMITQRASTFVTITETTSSRVTGASNVCTRIATWLRLTPSSMLWPSPGTKLTPYMKIAIPT